MRLRRTEMLAGVAHREGAHALPASHETIEPAPAQAAGAFVFPTPPRHGGIHGIKTDSNTGGVA
jgi:hypothetical protein